MDRALQTRQPSTSPEGISEGRCERYHRVTFLPANRTVQAREGMSLLDVALENGIDLEHNCGGNCSCATCHVIVREGMQNLSPKGIDEEDQLDLADDPTPDSRLGCQARVFGDVVVEIPPN